MTLWANQAVDRTAAPQVFDEGGSHGAAFGHCRRWGRETNDEIHLHAVDRVRVWLLP